MLFVGESGAGKTTFANLAIKNKYIATSKIAVTLDNRSKKWYNMSQGDEKNGQNAAQ